MQQLLHPSMRQRLGVDGYVPFSGAASNDCCPVPLDVPVCDLACSFVDIMPSGPMWDHHKAQLKDLFGGSEGCDAPETVDTGCSSMAHFAVYGARVLNDMLDTSLRPALREAYGDTASTTLDDWLDRLGWQDCYRTACSIGGSAELSPYMKEGDCGLTFVEPEYPEDYERALKHAIIRSLLRLQRGIIKNLDSINFVIEPLGSAVTPVKPWPLDVRENLAAGSPRNLLTGGPECFCAEARFCVSPIKDTLPGAPTADGSLPAEVSAVQIYDRDGDRIELYPGVFAAMCIVRSLFGCDALL